MPGPWGTTPVRRRAAAYPPPPTSAPSKETWPVVGCNAPSSRRMEVLLPAPFGPSRQTRAPTGIDQLTPSSATAPRRNRLVTRSNASAAPVTPGREERGFVLYSISVLHILGRQLVLDYLSLKDHEALARPAG